MIKSVPMKLKNILCKSFSKRCFRLTWSPHLPERVLAKETDKVSTPWYLLYQYEHDNLTTPTEEDLRLRVASEHNADQFTIQKLKLNFLLNGGEEYVTRIYAAHDGLILCSTTDFEEKLTLYVCNPLTGKWVSLPDSQFDRWELIGFIVSCNNGSTKFKVVRVTRQFPNNCPPFTSVLSNFEVFSSDVGEWRDTGVALPEADGFGYYKGFNGVVHDGKLHWRVGTDTSGLIAYDPDKNECRVFSFNVPHSVRFKTGLIGTSCGRLCYANYADKKNVLSVCVLENYETQEWRPLLMTQMSSVLDVNEINHNDRWFSMKPLAFHPFDMETVYYETSANRIVSFNLQTQKLISFVREKIPQGFDLQWPISLFVVPPRPTSVPQPIWKTTSVP